MVQWLWFGVYWTNAVNGQLRASLRTQLNTSDMLIVIIPTRRKHGEQRVSDINNMFEKKMIKLVWMSK